MAVRYPRGAGVGAAMDDELHLIPIGSSETLRQGGDIAIVALGTTVTPALEAAQGLATNGIEATVVNGRFAKPLDSSLILGVARRIKKLVTVEENTLCGGFGSSVLALLQQSGISDVKVKNIGIPDVFVEHGTQAILRAKYSLDAAGIAREAMALLCGDRKNSPITIESEI